MSHPAVGETVVVARPRPGGTDRYLVAYYVTRYPVTGAELAGYLGRSLPAHLVPAAFVALPALPLGPSGKVDRAALPEPAAAPPTGQQAGDGTDRAVVHLVEQALGRTGVRTADTLRDLGADSLVATLVAARAEAALAIRLKVSEILSAGTVGGIAALARAAPRAPEQVGPARAAATYPVAPQQRRLYVEQLKDPAAVHYHVPVSVDLPAATDPARLVTALRMLTDRHDALRTAFDLVDGDVRQVVADRVDLDVAIDDPAPLVRPFDLARPPLWRAAIHRGAEVVRLRLDLHHLITDGLSLAVLIEELLSLAAGADLPPAPRPYVDYAHWTASPEAAQWRATQGAFWRDRYAGRAEHADLPLDASRPPLRPLDGGAVEFDLGPHRTDALRELAAGHDVTLFAVLAAAYAAFLAEVTGRAEVAIGAPMSGRTAAGFERTVGMFATTVCLPLLVSPELPFGALARQAGALVRDALAHQDHPLEDLAAAIAPTRRWDRNPLFDALLALHSPRYLTAGGLPLHLEWNGQAPFDLNLQLYDRRDTLRASWQYGSRLLRRETVLRWRDRLLDMIDTVTGAPATRVGDLTGGAIRRPVPDLDFDL
jgi:lichenysin synthetase B